MKNTFYSFLIIFSLPVSAFSQEGFFTWSAGSSELNMAFMDIEVMPDHSVVAIVKADGRGYGGVFLQADGEPVSLGLGDGGTGIIRFSPEGEVLWFKTVGDYYGGVYQVEKNAEGEIVVLANVEMNDEYTYQYEEYGDDEEEDYEGEEYEGEDYDDEFNRTNASTMNRTQDNTNRSNNNNSNNILSPEFLADVLRGSKFNQSESLVEPKKQKN